MASRQTHNLASTRVTTDFSSFEESLGDQADSKASSICLAAPSPPIPYTNTFFTFFRQSSNDQANSRVPPTSFLTPRSCPCLLHVTGLQESIRQAGRLNCMTANQVSEQQARAAHAAAKWYSKLAALLNKTTQRTAFSKNPPDKPSYELDVKQKCAETMAVNTPEQHHLAYTGSALYSSPIEDGSSMNSVLAVVIKGLGDLDEDVRGREWGEVSHAIVKTIDGGIIRPHQLFPPWPPPPPEVWDDAKKYKACLRGVGRVSHTFARASAPIKCCSLSAPSHRVELGEQGELLMGDLSAPIKWCCSPAPSYCNTTAAGSKEMGGVEGRFWRTADPSETIQMMRCWESIF